MGILDGKVALVTGAGQGVGRGIALAMAREGAVIAVVDRNGETAAETVALIEGAGGNALHRICDVENSDEVNACVASVVEATGTVDILVNNAVDAIVGIPLQDLDDEQFLISFASGPFASFWFMRACFPYLQDGGRVINLRSGTENQSMAGYGAYVAAKAAVGGLTRAAAREWGRHGITVNALVPFALSPSAEADLATAARQARSRLSAVVDSAFGRRGGRRRARRRLPGRAGRHVHHRLHSVSRRWRLVLRIVEAPHIGTQLKDNDGKTQRA